MNYARRHSYYVTRTAKWLESHDLIVEKVETNYCQTIGDRQVFVKRDLWGADLMYRSDFAIGFVQVKTGSSQVRRGINQLTEDLDWPPSVGRFVVWWDKGTKLTDGPNVSEIRRYPSFANYFPKEPGSIYIANREGSGAARLQGEGSPNQGKVAEPGRGQDTEGDDR